MSTLYLGIDVAKATFVAALYHEATETALGTFANSPDGFTALAAALPAEHPLVHLVAEPTGGYELPLVLWALAQGWQVSLPNPLRVRAWAKGQGRRAKTDRQDARLLARYGAAEQPPAWQPLPVAVSELDSLLRRKDDIEQMLRQERNRQQTVTRRPHIADAVPTSVNRVIGALEEELAALEQAIKDHLQQHPDLAQAAQRLQTVPGVGKQTVLPLLVLLTKWQVRTDGQGTAKGLTAYAGFDPQPYESGTSVRKRSTISRMGDPRCGDGCFYVPWAGCGGRMRCGRCSSGWSGAANRRSWRWWPQRARYWCGHGPSFGPKRSLIRPCPERGLHE